MGQRVSGGSGPTALATSVSAVRLQKDVRPGTLVDDTALMSIVCPSWRVSPKSFATHDNEVIKTLDSGDHQNHCHAARGSANRRDPLFLARKRIANCNPIDCLAVSHVFRIKCVGASMERSRDDE